MATAAATLDTAQPAAPTWLRRISIGKIAANLLLLFFVVLWTFPTLGLFVSSLRDRDQLSSSGWWTSFVTATHQDAERLPVATEQKEENGSFVLRGNLLAGDTHRTIQSFGTASDAIAAAPAGGTLPMRFGGEVTVQANGDYVWSSPTKLDYPGAPRLYFVSAIPPRITLENYYRVLTADGIGRAFINSATVTIPATIIPIMIAAFAAYALAWMQFPGRTLAVIVVVGLLVVPLQMSLIPVLRIYNGVANTFHVESKGYVGVWLAHTAFGLPLAIYLLRNYMVGLPREIMESARMDGASHFKIFMTMVLPLSFPALASFAIFQFLWVWNDLLVALVFLGAQENRTVLTGRLVTLLGSHGSDWELLTSGAFITIVVPLIVFFSLQRYFVRGLLAGSVK
ncbi:MAG: carbohydrate ABC transporter permease [Devosia sp.]